MKPIEKTPNKQGEKTRAWLCDKSAFHAKHGVKAEDDATLAMWIVEAPWAHPVWHSYAIILVHLRELPDKRETKIYLEGATHEMWVVALNPDADREQFISHGTHVVEGAESASIFLEPLNFAAQFIETCDEYAFNRVEKAVEMICARQLSPDTDFRRQWEALFGSSMVKK